MAEKCTHVKNGKLNLGDPVEENGYIVQKCKKCGKALKSSKK